MEKACCKDLNITGIKNREAIASEWRRRRKKKKKTENISFKQTVHNSCSNCLTKDAIWLFQKLATTTVTLTGTTFRTAVCGGRYLTTYTEATLHR